MSEKWICKKRAFKETWIDRLSSDVNLQISDGTIPGLFLRYYYRTKTISFFFSCRIKETGKRKITFMGKWSEFENVDAVYARAKEWRKAILKDRIYKSTDTTIPSEDVDVQSDPDALKRNELKRELIITANNKQVFDDAFMLYTEKYSALYKKPSTQHSDKLLYRVYIKPLFGKKLVQDIKERDLIDAYATWAKRTSFSTANKILSLVSSFWDWCESYGYMPRKSNLCGYVKRGTNPKYKPVVLDQDGYKRFFQSLEKGLCMKSRTHSRMFRVIKVLALTGCRRSEIRDLEIDEVSLAEKIIHLKDSKTGPRDVKLSDAAVKELEIAIKEAELIGSKYVFPGIYDKNQPVDNIRKPFEWILKDAGLPHMRLHDLRHSFITMGANLGENMNAIKDAAGHSRLATTEHYTHYADTETFKAVNHITEAICQ